MVESLLFIGAGAGARVGAGEKILGAGAGQKWTGFATFKSANYEFLIFHLYLVLGRFFYWIRIRFFC